MGVLLQFVSVITFTAWGLYVWADVKNFGDNAQSAQCNDKIKYVVFFFTVRATAPWLRGIWITGLVLSAVGLMLSFGWKAMELFEMKRMAEEQQVEETNTIAYREVAVTQGTRPHAESEIAEKGWYFDMSFTLLLFVPPLLSYHRHSRIAAQLGNIFYGHARTHGEWPYLSYSTYYSLNVFKVRRNAANKQQDGSIAGPGVVDIDNKWEFGQVLAVVMILANANEILHFFFGFLARRKLARERQAQTEEIALQSRGQSTPPLYGARGPSGSNVSSKDSCMS